MTATAELAIDVTGVTKRFGGKTVVNGIDLQVETGEIYGFLGPNGSGKTTFIRMLCGLLTPDAGSGTCLGRDILHEQALIKSEVGYMTQRFSYYEDLSIRENLDFIARIYGISDRKAAVDRSLERLGLANRSAQLAGQLSGGWKQRLALAACLIHGPKLLLLDEPTAGVDPKARREFWDEIHRLSTEGITVLITTHYMDEAERCHRLAFVFRGALLDLGTPAEILQRRGLRVAETVAESRAMLEVLRADPRVEEVAPFGARLRVTTRAAHDPAAVIREAQARSGAPHADVTEVRADLEDAFVSMVRDDARTA